MELHISDKKGVDIRPGMMGLFFEDINYAADGGLHAEMIENRSFEFFRATGFNDSYVEEYDGGYGWTKYPENNPFVSMEYRTEAPLTQENPHYLHFRSAREKCGFVNKAYDGIFLKAGENYRISFYVRILGEKPAPPPFSAYLPPVVGAAPVPEPEKEENGFQVLVMKHGDVFLEQEIGFTHEKTIANSDGEAHQEDSRSGKVSCIPCRDGWQWVSFTLTAQADVDGAEFVIVSKNPVEVDFDFISMMPENAVCGVFRKDLAELLKELKPGFLRFPGGCIIEGNSLNNRYQWKLSVGDVTRRKANWNRWAVHGNRKENNFTSEYTHYNQTLGIGYYEYFLLCEYLGAKALPVLNVGLACQYQSHELVETDDPRFQEFIQDALDLVEFANGDIDTKWGGLRADMGHPEPFHLEFIGIGNEQWETDKVNFFERYTRFEQAIHAKYPDMKLIGSAGPDVHTKRFEAAWNFYRKAVEKNEKFTYAVDEHYYMPPEWFLENTHFYDEYPREVKVFSGEYAAHPKERAGGVRSGNTLEAALAEAAFLTGVERNADVVVMSSYAPLLARVGYAQWSPDLIWFDAKTAYGTPSYYVQKMFADNMGSHTLKTEASEDMEANRLFASVSFDGKAQEWIIKFVNASEKAAVVKLFGENFAPTAGSAVLLGGSDSHAYNTIEQPEKVAAVKRTLSAGECQELTIPAHTFGVYRMK